MLGHACSLNKPGAQRVLAGRDAPRQNRSGGVHLRTRLGARCPGPPGLDAWCGMLHDDNGLYEFRPLALFSQGIPWDRPVCSRSVGCRGASRCLLALRIVTSARPGSERAVGYRFRLTAMAPSPHKPTAASCTVRHAGPQLPLTFTTHAAFTPSCGSTSRSRHGRPAQL